MNKISLLINFILTWIFLLPAYLIRFVFVKKPISKNKSLAVSAIVYMIQALLSIVAQDSQNIKNPKIGPAVFLVAFISYKMLRSNSSSKVDKRKTVKNKKKAGKQSNNINTFTKKIMLKKLIFIGIVLLFIGLFIKIYQANKPNLALTDKSQVNSVVIGNLYRNTKYNFRIKFPEGWNISDGDGPNVVQKASKDNRSINILIKEFSSGVDSDWTINDVYNLEDLKDELISVGSDGVILDSGESYLDNKPALWVKYSTTYSTLDLTVEMILTQYYLLYNKILYAISIGSTTDDFNSAEAELMKSVSTFAIEDYQNENTVNNGSDLNQNRFQTIKTFAKKSCGLQMGGEEIYTDWFKIDGDVWKIKISSEKAFNTGLNEGISNTRVWYTNSSDPIMDEILQKKPTSYVEVGSGIVMNEEGLKYVEQEALGPGKYRLRILCWNTNYSIEVQDGGNQWTEYYLNKDKFKISLPSEPSESNVSINVLNIRMPYIEYLSSTGYVDYYASYINAEKLYEKELQISEETKKYESIDFEKYAIEENTTDYYSTLSDVYDVLFKNRTGVRKIEKIKNHFDGYYVIDYLWKSINENRFIKGKIIIVNGKDLYILSAESENSDFSKDNYLDDYINFINSWKPFGESSE